MLSVRSGLNPRGRLIYSSILLKGGNILYSFPLTKSSLNEELGAKVNMRGVMIHGWRVFYAVLWWGEGECTTCSRRFWNRPANFRGYAGNINKIRLRG